jgi:hypothetical protein
MKGKPSIYTKEEAKISKISREWLSAGSNGLIQQQARMLSNKVKSEKRGKYYKIVMISDKPKTWKEIEVPQGTPGAIKYE